MDSSKGARSVVVTIVALILLWNVVGRHVSDPAYISGLFALLAPALTTSDRRQLIAPATSPSSRRGKYYGAILGGFVLSFAGCAPLWFLPGVPDVSPSSVWLMALPILGLVALFFLSLRGQPDRDWLARSAIAGLGILFIALVIALTDINPVFGLGIGGAAAILGWIETQALKALFARYWGQVGARVLLIVGALILLCCIVGVAVTQPIPAAYAETAVIAGLALAVTWLGINHPTWQTRKQTRPA